MLDAFGERWSRWHHNSRGVCIRMFDLLGLTASIYSLLDYPRRLSQALTSETLSEQQCTMSSIPLMMDEWYDVCYAGHTRIILHHYSSLSLIWFK